MEIKDIIGIVSLAAMLMTGLWAYTKYFLERGFLPPIRFYVTLKKLGKINNEHILDIKIHLHNTGSTTLIARNIRLDLRYLRSTDTPVELFGDIVNNKKVYAIAGRLNFPGSIINDKEVDPSTLEPRKIRRAKKRHEEKDQNLLDRWKLQKKRGFLVIEDDTFVQAGVDQAYTFVTKVPKDTLCCLAWCSFQYAQEPKNWQKMVSRFSRFIGLIQYTLEHVQIPHTVEDAFWIAESTDHKNKKTHNDDNRDNPAAGSLDEE